MSKRKFLKALVHFIWRVASSRLGQILFLLHLVLVVYAYTSRESVEPVHFHYESALLKSLLVLDLPALTVATILAAPIAHVNSPFSSYWWAPWVTDGLGLLCASIQWWFVGFVIQWLFWSTRVKSSSVTKMDPL